MNPKHQSIVFSRSKKLLFALVPVSALLALTELGVRIFGPGSDPGPDTTSSVEADPHLIWRLKQGRAYQTNELGFRDDEPAPNAQQRVVLLGDSISWGEGIPTIESAWPQMLERVLTGAGHSICILNSAVPGYSTFQQVEYLERRGLDLKPDIVVLQFSLDDVVERYSSVFAYGGADYFEGVDTRAALDGPLGALVRNVRSVHLLVKTLQARSRGSQAYDVRLLSADELTEELEGAWRTVLSELDELAAICARESVPLLLVIAPYAYQVGARRTLDQPQARLRAWASANGVETVDLLSAFNQAQRAEDAELFLDTNHFSALGHAITAETVATPLLQALSNRKSQ